MEVVCIYPYQILERELRKRILNGTYAMGDKMPSIRIIAEQERYASATVQRAFHNLKRQGLLVYRRSTGYLVSEHQELERMKAEECYKAINTLYDTLYELGCSESEIGLLLQEIIKK